MSDTVTLTIFLKHDQSKNLDMIQAHLDEMEWWDRFPPAGVEILSWNVVMGIGQIVTLRMPPSLIAKVNVELERSAWKVFSTEFFPTYDFLPVRERLRREWQERRKAGKKLAPIPPTELKAINPKTLPAPPTGLFNQAVVANGFIYMSGIHAGAAEGTIGGEDVGAQTQEVFRRIQAILEDAGSSLEKIVKLTIYTKSMKYREEISKTRKEVFSDVAIVPASTFVEVSGFIDPRLKVEIDAIAVL